MTVLRKKRRVIKINIDIIGLEKAGIKVNYFENDYFIKPEEAGLSIKIIAESIISIIKEEGNGALEKARIDLSEFGFYLGNRKKGQIYNGLIIWSLEKYIFFKALLFFLFISIDKSSLFGYFTIGGVSGDKRKNKIQKELWTKIVSLAFCFLYCFANSCSICASYWI